MWRGKDGISLEFKTKSVSVMYLFKRDVVIFFTRSFLEIGYDAVGFNLSFGKLSGHMMIYQIIISQSTQPWK